MTRLSTLAAVLAAAAGGLVAGCGGSDAEPAAVTVVVTVPAPETSPELTPADPGALPTRAAGTPTQPTGTPAQSVGTPAPSDPAPSDEAGFWQLIAETRTAAGNDTGRQSELLDERLRQLQPQAIVEFARIRERLDRRAYTWKLWGAAYVIEDGCSDDCFRDFRGYIISLGRGPYEAALRDPDSLASVAQDAESGDWENADNVAPDAYSSVTGEDYPLDDSDLSGPPSGTPFNENDAAGLARQLPPARRALSLTKLRQLAGRGPDRCTRRRGRPPAGSARATRRSAARGSLPPLRSRRRRGGR